MRYVFETDPVRRILEVADTETESFSGYRGVVTELLNEDSDVEGVLVYFPGITNQDLTGGFECEPTVSCEDVT